MKKGFGIPWTGCLDAYSTFPLGIFKNSSKITGQIGINKHQV